jgi:hypothetical protein
MCSSQVLAPQKEDNMGRRNDACSYSPPCVLVQVLAPQKEDKIPGDVQPDTPLFAKLEDKSEEDALAYQNKEINNGECDNDDDDDDDDAKTCL